METEEQNVEKRGLSLKEITAELKWNSEEKKVHWALKEILHCHRKSESHYSTQIHKMLSHVTQMVIPIWYLVVGTCKEDSNDYEDAREGAAWAGFQKGVCVGCEMVAAKSMKYSV